MSALFPPSAEQRGPPPLSLGSSSSNCFRSFRLSDLWAPFLVKKGPTRIQNDGPLFLSKGAHRRRGDGALKNGTLGQGDGRWSRWTHRESRSSTLSPTCPCFCSFLASSKVAGSADSLFALTGVGGGSLPNRHALSLSLLPLARSLPAHISRAHSSQRLAFSAADHFLQLTVVHAGDWRRVFSGWDRWEGSRPSSTSGLSCRVYGRGGGGTFGCEFRGEWGARKKRS